MSGERWSWERGTVTRDLVMTEAEIRARQPQARRVKGCQELGEDSILFLQTSYRGERILPYRLQREHGPIDLDLNF